MKKIKYLFLILLFPILMFGCNQNNNYYFKFNFDAFSTNLGSIINVFEKDIKTNITDLSNFIVSSSDDTIASIADNRIECINLGSTTITVSGVVDDVLISDSFVLNVVNSSPTEEEDVNVLSIANYLKVEQENFDVYTFDIKLNDNYYNEFTYEIAENSNSLYAPILKLNNNLTVKCNKNETIKLKIYDTNKTTFIFVQLPNT